MFGQEGELVAQAPEFSFSSSYLIDSFNFKLQTIIETEGKAGALKYVCLIIISMVFLSNFFKYFSLRILTMLRVSLLKNLRSTVYNKILELHLGYFGDRQKGDILALLSNDVHEIEHSIVNSVQAIFKDPIMIIGSFVLLFTLSAKLTLFTLLIVPITGLVIASITSRLRRDARNMQNYSGKIVSHSEETLSGLKVIKSFSNESGFFSKFNALNNAYSRLISSVMNKRMLASPLSEFLGVSMAVAIVLYGGNMVLSGHQDFQAADFITFLVVYSQVLSPIKGMSNAVANVQRGLASGERIFAFTKTENDLPEVANAKILPGLSDRIEIKDVQFCYDENTEVLNNLNFSIKKGQTIALVGPSGGGKTTIANLIPRFIDPTKGAVLIDGHDLKDYSIQSVRSKMGVVTQENFLFNASIRENILFGLEDVDESSLIEAATMANAYDFIMALPNEMDANIGEAGGKLSGGQRQRISIARALLRDPEILILDEATSSLDTHSEKQVQVAINNLMKDRSSLIIAHRLSTVLHADLILVIEKGRILEQGSHEELMLAKGMYKRLIDLQQL